MTEEKKMRKIENMLIVVIVFQVVLLVLIKICVVLFP